MTLVQWVLIILLGIGVVAVVLPLKKRSKTADLAEALNNIRQIGVMLGEFETDYGRFPDDETALEVKRRTKTNFTLTGEYSNDYFRQMLADGRGKSERPFWCFTPLSPIRPVDDISTPAKALEGGEVGFSYIMASRTRGKAARKSRRGQWWLLLHSASKPIGPSTPGPTRARRWPCASTIAPRPCKSAPIGRADVTGKR